MSIEPIFHRLFSSGRFAFLAILVAVGTAAPACSQALVPSTGLPPEAPTSTQAAKAASGRSPNPMRRASAASAEHESVPASQPGHEGIGVHGHWTIDVKNADGTLASHRDFENALTGSAVLLRLLTGYSTFGVLGIFVNTDGSNVCTTAAGLVGSCGIVDQDLSFATKCAKGPAGTCNKSLTRNTDRTTGAITLAGTIPVVAAGSLIEVDTAIAYCSDPGGASQLSGEAPSDCISRGLGIFTVSQDFLTGTTISAIPVKPGQLLVVTVVLTFS